MIKRREDAVYFASCLKFFQQENEPVPERTEAKNN